MANIKSAAKRVRTSEERRQRNMTKKSKMRTIIKKYTLEIKKEDKTKDEYLKMLKEAVSILDKNARRGIIHPNKAARHKSQLTKQLNSISK